MKKLPIVLLSLIVLASCNSGEDDPGKDLSSDEAIAAIENMADQASQDVIDMMQSDGAEAALQLTDFLDASSEFGADARMDQESVKRRILKIAKFYATSPSKRVATDEPSDDVPTGIYEWDAQLEDFVWLDDSDDLILKFPAGDSEANNAIFTLSDLEFNVDDLPSKIVATLTIDETTMIDLHFVVNWSSEGLPEQADVYLFVNPFTFDLNYNYGTETTSLMFSIAKGDEILAAIDLESNLDLESEVLPVIEGSVEYRGVKIAGRVDLAGVDDAIFNETDPNEEIDLALFVDGDKVGDIVLVLETQDEYTEYVPYVVFEDGTEKSLEDLLESIFSTIDSELGEI